MINKQNLYQRIDLFQLPLDLLFRSTEIKLLRECSKKWLNTNNVILDLGCGNGVSSQLIFDRKIDYGLDINARSIELADQRGIYKKTLVAGAENIPLDDNSIDLVFSNCTLEHIKDLNSVLNEVFRVLKKKGKFVFTVPSGFYSEYNIFSGLGIPFMSGFYSKYRNKKLQHYHLYSVDTWNEKLNKMGLKIKDFYYYHTKNTLKLYDFFFIFLPIFRLIRLFPKLNNLIF